MVPTELLVTALVGGFAVALTAGRRDGTMLGSRISDLRAEMTSRFQGVEGRFDGTDRRFDAVESRLSSMQDEMLTIRASLGAIDARLTTLADR